METDRQADKNIEMISLLENVDRPISVYCARGHTTEIAISQKRGKWGC